MTIRHRLKAAFAASATVFCVLGLVACGGQGSGTASTSPDTPNQTQPSNTTGRLLASNCFQCHGTGGVGGFENIRGKEASEVREYLQQAANSAIMAAHAQGYTSAQLNTIIAYLQQ
jgi:sulfide dehydrogenase cytochrome subunit